jgi:hypothetical protein
MADIQHSIPIAAKPETIYPLIATAKGFGQWWAADITESGGAVDCGWRSETDYFLNCNTTWGELMYRLKSAAEGKPRGPLFLASDLAY